MYLLDTDHISFIDRSEGNNLRSRLAGIPPADVVTSIINYEEQMRGWLAYINRLRATDRQIEGYRRLERTLKYYCATPLLPFDMAAIEHYQRLWIAGVKIGAMDLKIASIALVNNATVLTRNLVDFSKVPDLLIEDWTI